ncbi:hypothetical protein Hte_008774 [Hypoxylon texense]
MCYKQYKQSYCQAGDHFFGDFEHLRTDSCWKVLAFPHLGVGGCDEGITDNECPHPDPVVEKCDTCKEAEIEEADQADDEYEGDENEEDKGTDSK